MAQYTITEEEIKSIAEGGGKKKIKEMFPQIFENKLEVGKWYKFNAEGFNYLLCYSGEEKSYGFFKKNYGSWYFDDNKKYAFGNEATNEEVEAALIAEAKKRGFVDGAKVKGLDGDVFTVDTLDFWNAEKFDIVEERFFISGTKGNCGVIFRYGQWAEIIKEKTLSKSEAESKLTELINDGFEYKIVEDKITYPKSDGIAL